MPLASFQKASNLFSDYQEKTAKLTSNLSKEQIRGPTVAGVNHSSEAYFKSPPKPYLMLSAGAVISMPRLDDEDSDRET
jgi:hypothetical protein